MKISELMAELHRRLEERGDIDVFIRAGEEGLDRLGALQWVRVRPASMKDYFRESATPEDEERFRAGDISDFGEFYPVSPGTDGVEGVYVGLAAPAAPTDRREIDLIARFARTFELLSRFDRNELSEIDGEPGGALPSLDDVRALLARLRAHVATRDDASDLVARERDDRLAALLGSLEQTVAGESAYPTIEEKAAQLLYNVIKNHPFADGNKRCGALLFLDFLHRNGRLFRASGQPVIDDNGLAALALLIADSDPRFRSEIVGLIASMIAR